MIIIKNQYKFKRTKKYLIGKGGFGNVYRGFDIENNIKVAIKVDNKKYNRKEFQIYKLIENKEYSAKVLDYYEDSENSYLIMPFYHISCDKIFKMSDRYFNLKDICMLCIQVIQQLHGLHHIGIIHRDIKPDNFVWDKNTNRIKLIDFGLCKPFMENGKHIKSERSSSKSGTLRYMSVNCQNGIMLSRRDDLISLAYSIIYLYNKKIPWKGINEKNKKKLYAKVKKMKADYNKNVDNSNLAEPIKFLISYALDLKFDQKPNYSLIMKVFYDYIKKSSKYNGKWSWINDNI